MKKLLKIILILILLVIVVVVLVIGYLGFVPGLSTVMGTDKPRNLGVTYTAADLASAQGKLEQKIIEPQDDPYVQMKAAQRKPVKTSLSNAEYSAHIEAVHPVKDFQIKMDGSNFEMSGKFDKVRIPQFLKTWGLTQDASEAEILDIVNQYLPGDPVFYVKGSGGTADDKTEITLTKAELGRLPVSAQMAEQFLEAYTDILIERAPAFSVKSAKIENGQLQFDGTTTSEIPKY